MPKLALTKLSFARLCLELDNLKKIKRKEIKAELIEAADLGDIYRENHPFDVAMAKQRLNERRIVELEALLDHSKIVKTDKVQKIKAGSLVKVKLNNQRILEFTLVTPEQKEIDLAKNIISTDSILGKTALGKQKGDIFQYKTPIGKIISAEVISVS